MLGYFGLRSNALASKTETIKWKNENINNFKSNAQRFC